MGSSELRQRLTDEAMAVMELRLPSALQAACADRQGQAKLAERTERLRKDCGALLDCKTEATQVHHERASELRREVMLFEAVEYLELHAKDVTATQVGSVLHMLE